MNTTTATIDWSPTPLAITGMFISFLIICFLLHIVLYNLPYKRRSREKENLEKETERNTNRQTLEKKVGRCLGNVWLGMVFHTSNGTRSDMESRVMGRLMHIGCSFVSLDQTEWNKGKNGDVIAHFCGPKFLIHGTVVETSSFTVRADVRIRLLENNTLLWSDILYATSPIGDAVTLLVDKVYEALLLAFEGIMAKEADAAASSETNQ